MPNLSDNKLLAKHFQISNLLDKNFESIQEFVNTANSRLDAIISITNNSINTTNKMSVCLRDGEIILRYVTYLLITNDDSILEKSCLKDLKNTYLSLGVPIPNAIRVVELIRDATISDIKTTVNLTVENKLIMSNLINDTKIYFEKIVNLLR